MKRVMEGPKLHGDFYDRDLRMDATMMKYSSPYPGVRAVAEPLDNSDVPVETIRAYFLGIGWAVMELSCQPFSTVVSPPLVRFAH